MSRRRTGFTLIELLVVVAIISLLISILLPSLGAARNQGKSAKCLANLHSIGGGFAVYSADFSQNILPYAWVDPGNIYNGVTPNGPYGFSTSYWFPEMAEWGYLTQGNNISANSVDATNGVANITKTPKSSIFMCPSGLDRADATWQGPNTIVANSYNAQFDTKGRLYQCNYLMSGLDPGIGSTPMPSYINDPAPNLSSMYPARYVIPSDNIGYAKEMMVEQPSAVGLMTDGFCIITYDSFASISTRHGNDGNSAANWLFMDGHAANLKKGTYPSSSTNPPADAYNPGFTLQQPQFEVRMTLRRL
jgi:prepilin-type N-terminal cleavage/methylation domain-containing protein/prepilin-type processing-associated H-X9-DG protein